MISPLNSLCALCFLASCNSPEAITTPTDNVDTKKIAYVSYVGCYQMVIEKDTAYMELKQDGDRLVGPLVYKRFEKDSNTGNVVLLQKKDRLVGWYTFQSEGMASVRQIVFLPGNNNLSEGYGDLGVKGDTAFFKYPATLQFEIKHPFNKVNCK